MSMFQDNRGFTLIELLLAMTLFSTVMIIATTGFVGMNRSFNRGVIQKELSEASQSIADNITQSLRAEGTGSQVQLCDENSSDPGNCLVGWSAVCFGQVRYLWSVSSNNSGMSKDTGPCSEPLSNDAITVLNERYRVRAFEVSKIDTAGLFRVRGVFTTRDQSGLTAFDQADPFATTCLGTSQAVAARTCSVEKFSFIISARSQ